MISNLIAYATPLLAIVFITLGFLTPLFAGVTSSPWFAAIPIVIALGIGAGLIGQDDGTDPVALVEVAGTHVEQL